MVRRSDLLEVGLFDEDIAVGEDYLAWVRILARGGSAIGAWEPLVRYRKRGGSACTNKVRAYRDIEKVHERFLDARSEARRSVPSSAARRLPEIALTSASRRRGYVSNHARAAWLACSRRRGSVSRGCPAR